MTRNPDSWLGFDCPRCHGVHKFSLQEPNPGYADPDSLVHVMAYSRNRTTIEVLEGFDRHDLRSIQVPAPRSEAIGLSTAYEAVLFL